jgi:hypothetical protein
VDEELLTYDREVFKMDMSQIRPVHEKLIGIH